MNYENFSKEVMEKVATAKTAEELLIIAQENNIELSIEEAQKALGYLHSSKTGKLSDEELNNVSGGACYSSEGLLQTTMYYNCEYYVKVKGEAHTFISAPGCSSCIYWDFRWVGMGLFGFTGDCLNQNNRER